MGGEVKRYKGSLIYKKTPYEIPQRCGALGRRKPSRLSNTGGGSLKEGAVWGGIFYTLNK